jgi:hypothetical protein
MRRPRGRVCRGGVRGSGAGPAPADHGERSPTLRRSRIRFRFEIKIVDEALVQSLGWWTIFVGNLIAATTMLAYFWKRHVGLGTRARTQWTFEHPAHQR